MGYPSEQLKLGEHADSEWFDVYVKDENGRRISCFGVSGETTEEWLMENDNPQRQQHLLEIWRED